MIDPHLPEEKPVVTVRMLRQFAALTVVILGGLASWHRFVDGRRSAADAVLIVIALLVGVLGFARPEKIRPIYATLVAVTSPIGRVMTWVVLAVLFYGLFTPLGLVLRLSGRDVLNVRRPNRGSHWTPKATPADLREYTRQS